MAVIEQALVSLLAGDPAVSAMVEDRIYPETAPQGESRARLTYQRISGQRVKSLDGPTGLAGPRFQVDCWAATKAESIDLARAVEKALDGFKATVEGVEIQGIFMDDERDGQLAPAHGDEEGDRRVSLDFFIWHKY